MAWPIMAQFTKQKAWLWWTLLAVAIVVVAGLAGRSQGPIVTIVTAGREDLQASIASNGKIEPISPTVAHAEFPTFVSSVKASEGQAVHRGQIILTLDDASIRSQLSQARASLLSSQTELRIAREGGPPDDVAQLSGDIEKTKIQVENLERTQKSLEQLVSDQAATQDDLAQNRASLAQARTNLATLQEKKEQLARRSSDNAENATLRVQEAKDQVRALEEQVKSATVVATADGTLYSLPVRAGDYVKVGEVLAEMADLQHVRVRAFVDEPDLGWLALNQMVEVTWDARPGQIWQGHIERLPMQVISRGTRSVRVVM